MAVRIEMDMPKSCKECKLKRYLNVHTRVCSLTLRTINTYIDKRNYCRHPKCPLKECK